MGENTDDTTKDVLGPLERQLLKRVLIAELGIVAVSVTIAWTLDNSLAPGLAYVFLNGIILPLLGYKSSHCPKCKDWLDPLISGPPRHCPRCGRELAGRPFVCPHCSHLIWPRPFSVRFCSQCGASLRGDAKSTERDEAGADAARD